VLSCTRALDHPDVLLLEISECNLLEMIFFVIIEIDGADVYNLIRWYKSRVGSQDTQAKLYPSF
jgi:hypothetical protein